MKKIIIVIIAILGVALGAIVFFTTAKNDPTEIFPENTNSASIEQKYTLEVTSNTEGLKSNQPTEFSYHIVDAQHQVVKEFAVVHEKKMHIIVVRKDLQEFQHIHPTFNAQTGEFTIPMTFSTDGPYRMFFDFTPVETQEHSHHQEPVVLNTDLSIGASQNYSPVDVVPDTQTTKMVDGYELTYTLSKPITTETPATISVEVRKDGKNVEDLEPYLGAMGHMIILKADTLDFVHAHAEDNASSLQFQSMFPSAGTYKFFTQFQHEGKVITSDYVIEVTGDVMEEMDMQHHHE